MKNKIKLVAAFIISMGIALSINSQAIAEYSFNDPEVPEESEEAASLLFDTLSLAFLSLEQLERNNLGNVQEIKYKILKNLKEVIKKQIIIKEKTSKRKIYQKTLPPDRLPIILRDFQRFGIKFPTYKNELPDIAIHQIEVFSEFINSMEFGNNAIENRKIIRLMINEVWSIVVLGVDLSEIAASVR